MYDCSRSKQTHRNGFSLTACLTDNEGDKCSDVTVYSKFQDAGSILKNNIVHDPASGGLSPKSPETSPMATEYMQTHEY